MFFRRICLKKIDNQQAHTTRNVKRISSGKIKMIPCGKLNIQKGVK